MRCASELNWLSGSCFALSTTLKSPGDMASNVWALGMVPSSSSHQHGLPLLGRVRLAGPFPDVNAPMQPSDSLPPSAIALVPLALAYLDADSGSVPKQADDTCARIRAVRRRQLTGSPLDRILSRRGEGLPGYGTVPFVRAMVEHPAGYTPLLAHTSMERIVIAFRENRTLGIREDDRFRGRSPMAHTFACLRIAALVSKNGARLATGSRGLTLGRMGFAPTGRCTKFHGGNASSNSLRPAGPGRTILPIRARRRRAHSASTPQTCRDQCRWAGGRPCHAP